MRHWSAEDLPGEWTHRDLVTNGVRLHVVEAGAGPLVVLLHGFPDFWYSWRRQIPLLARAGFRVLAPDLRGYNLSDRPAGLDAYRVPVLVEDVAGLIRAAGVERAVVVGHDWGGGLAWHLAMSRPECVERLVILNSPHPALFQRELHTFAQLLKSWYVFFFRLPLVPELFCRWHRFAPLAGVLEGVGKEDRALYRRAWERPGALTAALNWYRAMIRDWRRGTLLPVTPVNLPTLVLWGERDRHLGTRLLDGLEEWVPALRVRRFPRAGHWVHIDAIDEVNAELERFLIGEPGA